MAKKGTRLYFQGVPGTFMLALLLATVLGLVITLILFFSGNMSLNAEAARRFSPFQIVCSNQYSPVCGMNGNTYANSCFATRAKVSVACQGTCPCGSGRTVPAPIVY